MNILRWKRKSKNKIRPKTLILLIFSIMMTTFAWFAYSKVLNPTLNIHIASWDMEYYIGTEKQTNDITIGINTLYPAMDEQSVKIDIKNNGETLVDIDYYVKSVSIAGVSYELVQEGSTNTTQNYIVLTPPSIHTRVIGTDANTGEEIIVPTIVEGAITNDITKIPFTIELEHSAQVQPATEDDYGEIIPGEGYLTVKVNWAGDNDEFDSEWGYTVAEYLRTSGETSAISIKLGIDAYQADEEAELIEQILPSTAQTKPFLPEGFTRLPGTTLDTGLVIKDASGNQYVWVEVPKTNDVYRNSGLNITGFSTEEYTSIENDLKTYVETYRNETAFTDHFPDTHVYYAVGMNYDDYVAIKQKMLKSIYQNGGFYIGRYETGIENSYRTTSSGSTPSETPVIKANAYPYNFVTCAQAQSLASGMASGEYTSSVIFGLQWDLALKYLETKGVTESQLDTDSTTLGNYNNNLYYIVSSKAKYYATEWAMAPYEKTKESNILLSTGATGLFSRQNISGLAGNVAEWTLEYSATTGSPSVYRGGSFNELGTSAPPSTRYSSTITNTSNGIGFRVAIY